MLYQNGTHLKLKKMLVISSREFRQNQSMYLDKVDNGEQIIVQRGKNKSYTLTAVNEEDKYFNATMLERIKKSIEEAEKGEIKSISTPDEIRMLLGL